MKSIQKTPLLFALIFAVAGLAAAADDVYENNDVQTAARLLTIDSGTLTNVYDGLINGNDDWFIVQTPRAGYIHVQVDFDSADGNIDLELYDNAATPNLLVTSQGTGDEENAQAAAVAGQYFKIRVYGGSSQEYTLTISQDDQKEIVGANENDLSVDAYSLTFDAAASASLDGGDLLALDDDWYTFTPTTTNRVLVRIEWHDVTAVMALDSITGATVISNTTGTDWCDVIIDVTASTPVTFRVNPTGITNDPKYTLTLRADDTNDLTADNDALNTLAANQVQPGALKVNMSLLDTDVYWFTLSAPTPVFAYVWYPNNESITIELLDSVGTVLGSNTGAETYAGLGVTLAAGTYYYRLSTPASSKHVSKYYLLTKAEDSSEENDTFATAADMGLVGSGTGGADRTLTSRLIADRDFYKFTATANEKIGFFTAYIANFGDIRLDLYNAAGTAVIQSSTGSTTAGAFREFVILDAVNGTTYTFETVSVSSTVIYNNVKVQDDDTDDKTGSGNDTLGTATSLSADLIANGSVLRNDQVLFDDDYYSVLFPDDATIRVRVDDYYNVNANIDLEIQNSVGTVLASSVTTNNYEEILYNVTAGVPVFIRVFGDPSDKYDLTVTIDDAKEENDTFSSAKEIGVAAENFLVSRDDDYFFITGTRNANLQVQILFDDLSGVNNLDIEALDILGNPLDTSTISLSPSSTTQREFVSFPTTVGENYVIHVYESGSNYGEYETYRIAAAYDDVYDDGTGNDTSANATAVTPNSIYQNLVGLDDDWYVFTTAFTGEHLIRIDYTAAQGNLDLEVLDSSLAVLGSSSSAGDSDSVTLSLTAGTLVYVHVIDTELNLDSYTLTIAQDDAYEPNDTFATASTISTNTRIDNLVKLTDDADWFQVSVSAGDVGMPLRAEIFFSQAQGDLQLELYTPSNVLAASANTSTDNEFIQYTLTEAGNWRVKVPAADSNWNYSIIVALPDVVVDTGNGLNLSETGPTSDTLAVSLNLSPTRIVTVSLGFNASQITLSPSVLTFNSSTWNLPQTVTLTAIDDALVEFDHTSSITFSVSSTDAAFNGLAVSPTTVSITDNDIPAIPATPFMLGLRDNNLTVTAGTDNWYAVDISSTDVGGNLYVGLFFSNTAGDLALEIHKPGPGYETAGTSNTATDKEEIRITPDMSGTWYVRVIEGGANQSYDLMVAMDDSLEDNDTVATASPVSISDAIDDLVLTDDDWYRITATDTTVIFVGSFFMNDLGDVNVNVTDLSGSTIYLSGTTTTDDETLNFTPPSAGDYLVRVFSGQANPHYKFAAIIDDDDDNGTGNDTLLNATTISVNSYRADRRWLDDDWYTFSLSTSQLGVEYRAAIWFSDAKGDLDMEVVTLSGTVIGDSYSFTDNESVTFTPTQAGNYYIHVIGYDVNPDYALSFIAEDARDAGTGDDTPGTATAVTLPYLTDGTYSDDDWYKFTLSSTDTVHVDLFFSYADGDLNLAVYDGSGTVVLDMSASATDNETLLFNPSATGAYMVRVTGTTINPKYELVIAQDDDSEENDSASTATVMSMRSVLNNRMMLDDDWYEFSTTDSTEVFVEIDYVTLSGTMSLTILDAGTGSPVSGVIADIPSEKRFFARFTPPSAGTYRIHVSGHIAFNYRVLVTLEDDDDTESAGNDTRAAALAVTTGARLDRSLTDDDWYRIDLSTTRRSLYILASFSTSWGNLDTAVYTLSGTQPSYSSTSETDNESMTIDLSNTGTWLLKLSGTSNPTYDLTMVILEPEELGTGNDTASTAKPLALNTWYTASWQDADWWSVSLSATTSSPVFVGVYHDPAPAGDLGLTITTPDGGTVLASSLFGVNRETLWFDPSGTTAFLAHISSDGVNADYRIIAAIDDTADLSGSGNDTLADAYPLGAGLSFTGGVALDDDYFSFTPTTSGSIQIRLTFTHADGDIDMQALSASGGVLSEATSVTDDELIPLIVSAGTPYIIRIYTKDGVPNLHYSLTVSQPVRSLTFKGSMCTMTGNRAGRAFASPFVILLALLAGLSIAMRWLSHRKHSRRNNG